MQILELRQSGHLLVDFRIVLHGTRAQRIEAGIYTKVIIRQIGIVAHYGKLIALRKFGILSTLHRSRYLVTAIVILWQTVSFATLL
jgi:hypothetical protein